MQGKNPVGSLFLVFFWAPSGEVLLKVQKTETDDITMSGLVGADAGCSPGPTSLHLGKMCWGGTLVVNLGDFCRW